MILWVILALLAASLAVRVRITFYGAYVGRVLWAVQIRLGRWQLPEVNPRTLTKRRSRRTRPSREILGQLAKGLRGTGRARRYLLRHIRLVLLEGEARLATEDAARTALLSGGVRGLLAAIPGARRERVRLRVTPDFSGRVSAGKVRCIITFRLGILWAAAILLLWDRRSLRHKQAQTKEA